MRRTILLLLTLPALTAAAAPPVVTTPDPAAAMNDFLKAYWDAPQGYFLAWNRTAPFPRPSGAGPQGGRYTDFWWEAQLWDLMLDAAGRDPGNAQYRRLIGAVYDGMNRAYPDWQNDFNDDLGWWAQASARAYRLTGESRYLELAGRLFNDIWRYWTPDLGGGVLWRRSGSSQKNVATQGPLVVTAVRLYQATRDASYLDRAKQLYSFLDQKLTDGDSRVYDNIENGELRRWDFTYNVGNFVLASLALREVTTNGPARAQLLSRALKSADWALSNLTNAGILLGEGAGDGGGFKGVMVRALHELARAPDLAPPDRSRIEQSLRDNATQVWNSRRPGDGLVGPDWASVDNQGIIESLAAASAVAALQLAPGPLSGRLVFSDGRYEAENSAREGVESSTAAKGYSGRGYVNTFFQDGQSVEFRVNVPKAGRYALGWRYSAGGGDAMRALDTNGIVSALNFNKTTNWQTWAELNTTATLPAGSSRLKVRFDRASGSRQWLNLDRLTIGEAP